MQRQLVLDHLILEKIEFNAILEDMRVNSIPNY